MSRPPASRRSRCTGSCLHPWRTLAKQVGEQAQLGLPCRAACRCRRAGGSDRIRIVSASHRQPDRRTSATSLRIAVAKGGGAWRRSSSPSRFGPFCRWAHDGHDGGDGPASTGGRSTGRIGDRRVSPPISQSIRKVAQFSELHDDFGDPEASSLFDHRSDDRDGQSTDGDLVAAPGALSRLFPRQGPYARRPRDTEIGPMRQ